MKWSYLENSLPLRALYNITIQGHSHITTCDDLKRLLLVVSRDRERVPKYSRRIFVRRNNFLFDSALFKWRLIKWEKILSLQKYQCKHTEASSTSSQFHISWLDLTAIYV